MSVREFICSVPIRLITWHIFTTSILPILQLGSFPLCSSLSRPLLPGGTYLVLRVKYSSREHYWAVVALYGMFTELFTIHETLFNMHSTNLNTCMQTRKHFFLLLLNVCRQVHFVVLDLLVTLNLTLISNVPRYHNP
jgi:hypothetical protein